MNDVPTWKEAPKSALEVLKRARSLSARRGGWIKGTSAEMKGGWSTISTNPTAVRFCASGAIEREVILNHAKFLCVEAERMLVEEPLRREKVMRWLGWLQGLCYGMGLTTIHGSKKMNRP